MKGKKRLKIVGLHKILGMKWGSEDQWRVVHVNYEKDIGYNFTMVETNDGVELPECVINISDMGKFSLNKGEWVWEIKPLLSSNKGRELDRWEIFHQKELLRNLCYEVQLSRVNF
jgi:hypothetical protein